MDGTGGRSSEVKKKKKLGKILLPKYCVVCVMFWSVVDDLRAMLSKLESRMSMLEKNPSQAPKAAAASQVRKRHMGS